MQKNLDNLGGLVYSQRVLLALIEEANISREQAYALVQKNAMKIWRKEESSFLSLLEKEPEIINKLGKEKLQSLFDIGYHLKHIDHIFQQVFNN
jgi:adenylosuccinate lyase